MANANEMLIKYQVAVSNLTAAEVDKNNWESKMETLEKELAYWNQAKVLLELLKNHKLEKRKDFILTVINSALRDIFQEDYRLDILPKETRGKSASSTQKYDIIFYQNGIEIAKNDALLLSNGGGVLSIASLFFKILIGYLYSGNKFYIFDESLSQVSPQYRARLSTFLREFCDRYGFTLVVVSQTEELEIDAHIVYEVGSTVNDKGIPVLEIIHQEGELPESGFFYSYIENFQSIKKQNFVYSGFTVIRGPNNSGKSATLRAIESILFNNFQTDTYPRLNPDGGHLVTEIRFGYVPTPEEEELGKEHKEIGLLYKGKKVIFIINDEEYFGKSLASDKLKSAVEEIGFKYIDVKKLYKNFKGALKEQTERIAYTNQYDGLFLIGSKTSDSEKIFSFLFNTENIALAIAQAKDTMLEMNKEFKDIEGRLLETEQKIVEYSNQIDYYNKKYYIYLIQEYFETLRAVDTKTKEFGKLQALIDEITKLQSLCSNLAGYYSIQNSIDYEKIRFNEVNKKINLIEKIFSFLNPVRSIIYYLDSKKFITHQNRLLEDLTLKIKLGLWAGYRNIQIKIEQLKFTSNIINDLIPKYEFLVDLNRFFYTSEKYSQTSEMLKKVQEKILSLNAEFGLEKCSACSGTGLISCEH